MTWIQWQIIPVCPDMSRLKSLQSYYYCTPYLLCKQGCNYFNAEKKGWKDEENISIHRGLDPNGYNAYQGVTASGKPDKSAILSYCQEIGNLFWHGRLSQAVLRNKGKIAYEGVYQQPSGDSTMEGPLFGITGTSLDMAYKTIIFCSSCFTLQLTLIVKLMNGASLPQHRHYLRQAT